MDGNTTPARQDLSLVGYVANNAKPILLDSVIVFGLSLICGAITGFYIQLTHVGNGTANIKEHVAAIAISNAFSLILGFFIVGFRARANPYWRHLWLVTLLVWAMSLLNVAFVGTTLVTWFFSVIPLALFMGIGGGLGKLTQRRNPGTPELSAFD